MQKRQEVVNKEEILRMYSSGQLRTESDVSRLVTGDGTHRPGFRNHIKGRT